MRSLSTHRSLVHSTLHGGIHSVLAGAPTKLTLVKISLICLVHHVSVGRILLPVNHSITPLIYAYLLWFLETSGGIARLYIGVVVVICYQISILHRLSLWLFKLCDALVKFALKLFQVVFVKAGWLLDLLTVNICLVFCVTLHRALVIIVEDFHHIQLTLLVRLLLCIDLNLGIFDLLGSLIQGKSMLLIVQQFLLEFDGEVLLDIYVWRTETLQELEVWV